MADDRPPHFGGPPPGDPPAAPPVRPQPGRFAAGEPGFPQQVDLSPTRLAPPRAVAGPARPPDPEPKDGFREIVETIVFVVVLVLMLKTFLAEAFVIPTGSMATTLLGYHRDVICNACGYPFLVNASSETEEGVPVVSCHCPNCGYKNTLRGPAGGMP